MSTLPRNLTDEQIKRIAAKGGLVMINIGSAFLDQKVWDAQIAMKKRLAPEIAKLKKKTGKNLGAYIEGLFALYGREGASLPRAKLAHVADHIEHVIKVAGIDAVGLGTDFDGIPDPPVGFEDYSKTTALIAELLRRGRSETEVTKILGENFLAFFARVEAAKAKLAGEKPSTAKYKSK